MAAGRRSVSAMVAVLVAAGFCGVLRAQEPPAERPPQAAGGGGGRGAGGAAASAAPMMVPDSTTEGSVTVGGQVIAYKAVAGTITVGATDQQDATLGFDGKPLPDSGIKATDDGPPTARMFYAAYFKKDAPAEHRPVTFIYNGGPGSPTMWLHMGSFGPRRDLRS